LSESSNPAICSIETATAATRKRILRAALTEIVVRRDDAIIHAVLHWRAISGPEHPQQGVLIEAPLLDHGIAPR
jgi:hypothetical protein